MLQFNFRCSVWLGESRLDKSHRIDPHVKFTGDYARALQRINNFLFENNTLEKCSHGY
jgi:hypothetical protein